MKLVALFILSVLVSPAATYYVTVAGLGGEADYEQRFSGWAKDLDRVFREDANAGGVHTLSGPEATRERLEAVIAQVAGKCKPSDSFALTLIGHGSYDGVDYKMNLPGPDISATELAALMERVPATRQLVANMTSASGGALAVLQRPNRTVISATKTGTQRNAVVFPRFWVAALQDSAADVNKNEAITVLEAFQYADRKTQDFYKTQNRLATEHALLEDTGSGEGVRTPGPSNGKGLQAGQFSLLRVGKTQLAAEGPTKRALLDKKELIEQQIDELKYRKAALPEDEYRSELTALLVELARTQNELDR